MHQRFVTHSLALLLAGLSLTGCGFGTYGYDSSSSYDPPPDTYDDSAYVPPAPTPADTCEASSVDLVGTVAADIVATWQDWEGGSFEVVSFDASGTVSVWQPNSALTVPADAADGGSSFDGGEPPVAAPDAGGPPIRYTRILTTSLTPPGPDMTLITSGQYAVNATADTVAITWSDGATEVVAVQFVSYPGCTMMPITGVSAGTSRLPNLGGELERVSCASPADAGVVP